MRTIVKLPLYFLLLFLAVILLLSTFSLLYSWGTVYDAESRLPGFLIPATIILSSRSVLSAAVLLSIVILLFRLVRLPGNRALLLLAIAATASLVYLAAFAALDNLKEALVPGATTPTYSVPSNQFLSFPQADVYVGQAEGLKLSPVIVYQTESSPGFARYGVGVRDPVENLLIVPEAGMSPPIDSAVQSYVSLFDPPPFLRRLIADLSILVTRLGEFYPRDNLLFVLTAIALVTAVVSSWCFVRLTRWPLFNGLLTVAFVRGLVFVYALLGGEFFRQLASSVVDPAILEYLAPGFLLVVALVMFSATLLLTPFEDWRREMGDE